MSPTTHKILFIKKPTTHVKKMKLPPDPPTHLILEQPLTSLTLPYLYLSQARIWISKVICDGILCSVSSVKMRGDYLFCQMTVYSLQLSSINSADFIFHYQVNDRSRVSSCAVVNANSMYCLLFMFICFKMRILFKSEDTCIKCVSFLVCCQTSSFAVHRQFNMYMY